MDLKAFISQTLVQIVQGLDEAQEQLKETRAIVNPYLKGGWTKGEDGFLGVSDERKTIFSIDFDVALIVSEDKSLSGKFGLMVASLSVGTQASSTNASSTQNRIPFKVPLAIPPPYERLPDEI